MHSIKHAPNDVLRWGDTENMNVEGPENLHKEWVKAQGGKTNQGPTPYKTLNLRGRIVCGKSKSFAIGGSSR